MPDMDIKKALELLKKAHSLLKTSECDNLKESTNYLTESIKLLNQHRPGTADNVH